MILSAIVIYFIGFAFIFFPTKNWERRERNNKIGKALFLAAVVLLSIYLNVEWEAQ